LKKQHSDLDDPDISELNIPSIAYGDLEDNNDGLEQLSALASSLKAPAVAKENKENMSALSHFVQLHNHK
jgi:hypothetical protein